jgi:drug/metabolite transporter (DMT)-like permease
MGILLGLASALSWGTSDLLARFATRKIGTFRAMLYMQMLGCLLITLAMHWLGGWGHLFDGSGARPWIWGVLAGLLNTLATLALYRSFETGKMSVVAPISASYPVLTFMLSAATGEHVTPARTAGIAFTILGVILVARGENVADDANSDREPALRGKKRLGVGWAIAAALGFGVMFWLLGIRVVPLLGAAPSVWLIRLTSVLVTAAVIAVVRVPLVAPAGNANPWLLGMAILDTSSYVLNNYGMQHEQTSVVSALASLYGAVTVGLAAILLKEPVSRVQWFGIVLIFAGIVLISR